MYCLTSDLNLVYLLLIHVGCLTGAAPSKPSKNKQQLMIGVITDQLEFLNPESYEKTKNRMNSTVTTSLMKA